MFAVVRTGGKQYRVAPGDKIAVEKLAGEAGDTVTLGDVLLAGSGAELSDAGTVTVSAEIIAQAKSEKVIVFKKRRRHNYRRKNGHRQQMTLLRIVAVGDEQAPPRQQAALEQDAEPVQTEAVASGNKADPSESPKGPEATKQDKVHKAEPLKDHAPAKPADDKSDNA
jgi:large subunit ribosomal protein L21